jgi:hypothetical protein
MLLLIKPLAFWLPGRFCLSFFSPAWTVGSRRPRYPGMLVQVALLLVLPLV